MCKTSRTISARNGSKSNGGALLASRKLFPLLASLHYENGAERFRFEVQAVTPQKLTEEDAKSFQPPAGWLEIRPLPF